MELTVVKWRTFKSESKLKEMFFELAVPVCDKFLDW